MTTNTVENNSRQLTDGHLGAHMSNDIKNFSDFYPCESTVQVGNE